MKFQRKWIDYLNQYDDLSLLVEARVKDIKKQYPQLTELGWLDLFRQNIETNLGPKGVSKYLLWAMQAWEKIYPEGPVRAATLGPVNAQDPSPDNNNKTQAEEVLNVIFGFQRTLERHGTRMEEKDIYRLDMKKARELIDKYEKQDTEREKREKEKAAAKAGSTFVYEDHGVFAVRPNTTEASCYFGRNTRWCISATQSKNYFQQYTEEGRAFVMVRIDKLPEDHVYHKIALVFARGGNSSAIDAEYDVEEAYDASDDRHDPDILYTAMIEAGIDQPDAAEAYSEIIQNGRDIIEESPPESGFEIKAENILKEWTQNNRPPDSFSAYYEVMDGDSGDYLSFGGDYFFRIDDDQLGEEEMPDSWGSDSQQFMDDIREVLDQEASYYGVEEVDVQSDGILLRISPENYEPNPNGFDDWLYNLGISRERAVDIESVLADHLRKEGYMKHTAVSDTQQKIRDKEEHLLSDLGGYAIANNDHEGIFAVLKKKFVVYNGKIIGPDKLPKRDDYVYIDMSDKIETAPDKLSDDYIKAAVTGMNGSYTQRTLRNLEEISTEIADELAKQQDLPIPELPELPSKAFIRKSIPKYRLLVKAIKIKTTALGDHALAFFVNVNILNPVRREISGQTLKPSAENIQGIAGMAKYIQDNEDLLAKAVKETATELINREEFSKQTGLGENVDNEIEKYFTLLSEEKNRPRQRGIYKFYCMLGYTIDVGDAKRGLDDILAEVRALPTVTIVNVAISNRKVAEQTYIAGLSVKFIPSYPGTFSNPEDAKAKILRSIKRIRNVQRIFKVSTSLERIE
jgi:hypothetical protein